MDGSSNNDGDESGNDKSAVLAKEKGGKKSSSPDSAYSIEVCQGPYCKGLGGEIAVLEIEELVREQYHQSGNGIIPVVAGGCRFLCNVGPNAHVLVQRKKEKSNGQRRARKITYIMESFQNVKDTSSCDLVVNTAIAYSSSPGDNTETDNSTATNPTNEIPRPATSSANSMMARRAGRTRWEALKDVSRTIAKCKKFVAASDSGSGNTDNGFERKLRISKETCSDRIGRATTNRPSQRDKRRTERLIEIASEKLDRICLQVDEESDSSSYSSSDESDTSDDSDE